MALPQNFKVKESAGGAYILSGLQSGDSVKFRVLTDYITGQSVWGDKDGKRVITRARDDESIPVGAIGVNMFTGRPESVKQFIAAVVYNYSTKQCEIFETDKVTLIEQVMTLEQNEDWGDSKEYDMTISKTGQKQDTKYQIMPSNKRSFDVEVDHSHIDLNKLYSGDNPFSETVKTEDIPF